MKRPREAAPAVPPCTDLLVGCHLWLASSVQPAENSLLRLMLAASGALISDSAVQRHPAADTTHVVVARDRVVLGPTMAFAPAAVAVSVAWLWDCVKAKERLAIGPYECPAAPRPSGGAGGAGSHPSAAAAPAAAPGLPRCSGCRRELWANNIELCDACLSQRGAPLAAFALHHRFVKPPQANGPLEATFRELLCLEEAMADSPNAYHNKTQAFACACALLRALPDVAALLLARTPVLGGPKITAYIDEFVRSGRVERLERLRRNPEATARATLLRIPWVGHSLAGALARKGVRTVEQAKTALLRGEGGHGGGGAGAGGLLDGVGGGAAAHPMLLAVLRCPDPAACCGRVPPAEAAALVAVVSDAAASLGSGLHCEQVGGCKRGPADDAHDVDILVTHDSDEAAVCGGGGGGGDAPLGRILAAIRADPRVAALDFVLSGVADSAEALVKEWRHRAAEGRGGSALVGAANIDQLFKAFALVTLAGAVPRRVDVVMVPPSQWAPAVLGWSGTRQYLRWMRLWCAGDRLLPRTGPTWVLSNHGLYLDERGAGSGGSAGAAGGPDAGVFLVTRGGGRVPAWDVDAVRRDYVGNPAAWWRTEQELFAAVGLPYRPPSDRCA